MIELVLKAYLESVLSCPVYTERPENKPDTYVLLHKMGGGLESMIDKATLSFEIVGRSLYEVSALRDELKRLLFGSNRLDNISDVEQGGESINVDKTANKGYKSEVIFNFTYYDEKE